MHRAEAILNQVATLVTGLTTTGANVHKSRAYAVDTLPALNVDVGADTVENISNTYIDSDLNIIIQVYVKATETSLANQILTIREEVHVALMADATLGLTYVIDSLPTSMTEPVISSESEKPVASVDLQWLIKYRSPINNPGV